MSERHSVHMKGPKGESFGHIQATIGQMGRMHEWMAASEDDAYRQGRTVGVLVGWVTSMLVYGSFWLVL